MTFKDHIFVFGSNLAGRHGAGAALTARKKYGAVYGVGKGPTGKAYALPTKDRDLKSLSLELIQEHVNEFITYAGAHPELTFYVTPVGCGLAGYTHEEISPMFKHAPVNCLLPAGWRK